MRTKFFYILIIVMSFTSCKSAKTSLNTTALTYASFKENQKSFLSSDGNIKYIDKGKGNVILLLHGVPSSSWLYRKMIDELVAEGFRVIAPDMLGFGNSDNPDGYDLYNAHNHGKRILELMNGLKINTWTHITHDAGGLWTWELLKQDKKRIEKLILLNTIIYEEGFKPPIRMKRGFFAKTSMWMYRNGITTNLLLNGLFKSGLMENNLTENEIEGYKIPLREGKTKAMYYFFSKTCNALPDYSNLITSLNLPVVLIWGKYDKMLQINPQKNKLIKALKIKDENIHIIEAKHFIQEEKPKEINKIIVDFLKE
ncbi:alpha/beta hydrolase [uncultured Polaribacter sp.]|uniref:alpha/beta fold hydrolase n=1 Tax=uncultured Polaribacter sp. TaxID=174711 RepID=UPI00262F6E68|nr:alpha/beta hydrolase [uncultured Polaribacter sp.]